MRPDLLALGPDVLAELTNVGTARRAAKELAAGARFTFSVADGVVTATDDEVTCVLGLGAFGTWTCSCAAGERCRHLVRAVLQWQADAGATPRADEAADARPEAPAPGPEPPADGPVFAPRVQAEADRILAGGIIATATDTGARARVRFFHPEHVAVRFLVGHDPRYARCECGVAGCVHVALAAPVLAGQLAGTHHLTATLTGPVPVPATVEESWRAWLGQLLDLGLPAAAELMAGVVRLATDVEAAGLAHPAAALRELAEQLELRLSHSARLSPVRQLELLGEVTARLRALGPGRPHLPPRLVAGSAPGETRGGPVRLTGLGAEYRQVGGWHELRAYLLDTGTMAVRTVTISRTDSDDVLHTPASLAQVRRGGSRLLDFAAGRGLLPRSHWVGDELVLPRGRWTMLAVPALEVDQEVLSAGFALAAAGDGGVPAALGPRRPADGVAVAGVAEVTLAGSDGARVLAELRDATGAEAVLRLQPDPRAGHAADALAAVLASGGVTAVAGRWRPGLAGQPAVVAPTAVWWSGGVYLPQLGLGVGDEPPGHSDAATPARSDPWELWWEGFANALGRLLLTGARRGAAQSGRALADSAAQARSLGLARCAEAASRIVEALPYPERRLEPFLDACVLLALRE